MRWDLCMKRLVKYELYELNRIIRIKTYKTCSFFLKFDIPLILSTKQILSQPEIRVIRFNSCNSYVTKLVKFDLIRIISIKETFIGKAS